MSGTRTVDGGWSSLVPSRR